MFRKPLQISLLALFLGLVALFATIPGSWAHFKFTIGNFDREGEMLAIEDTLRLFSGTVAGFYASGGNLAGLNMFPAEKLIKRRIFQDIEINLTNGHLLIMDRDRTVVKEILFSSPEHATVVRDEAWFLQYQEAATRRPLSGKKANLITVRYLLKKMWGRWIIVDYDVYGRNDAVSPVRPERLARW